MTGIYIIQSGDTMLAIASQFNCTLPELVALNSHISDPNLIYAGQQLNVPDRGVNGSSPAAVHSGDDPQWYKIAFEELNTTEFSGDDHNPRIIEYHSTTTLKARADEVPWCSSFVNWCVEQAGLAGTKSAAARSWLQWGTGLAQPQKGCIVVLSSSRGPTSGHVGFFVRQEGNHVLLLGGNQNNSVNFSSYSRSRLLGYRWLAQTQH
ncbi:TIGR02594 family protein (plasmid) [Roseibium aggregatum]|uniref:TIGR02594 family protein n=1 Tax=Roseibium aggregatum TaxID=187304 RepID=UPI001E58E626|nr:TIGR02594 family protein [Roseibium aggregatum]UES60204.1 TIGR02594 family protein [Roseibium aggregatum]